MSHLKSCIEASNAVKKASDETVNFCFTQIVNEIFDGKRNLLRSLLSPQSNLKQHQIEEIKQIFHTKCQKSIETQSDIDAMDMDQTPLIPTLIIIPETTQTVITSFLNFQSINQLKNTCSSIAPVCITELITKMDIKVLNVHELITHNHGDKIQIDDIIESSFKTHRVHKSHTLKSFVQNEATISFDNLLCFKHRKHFKSTMMNGITDSTTISDLKGSAFLFMDKALSPQSATAVSPVTILFVQEFDIKHQSLRITDIVHPNNNLMSNDIKQMIKNRIHEDVTLYVVSIGGQVQRLVGNCYFSQYNIIKAVAIIYQRNSHANMSESTKEEFKVFNYKQLKPFYESVQTFYNRNRLIPVPGMKYNELGLDLKENYEDLVPYEDIAKCFKKAYDLSPNYPPFIANYIRSLVQCDKEEHIDTAQQLFQQKLQLHADGMLDIHDKVLRELCNIMAQAYQCRGEDEDKTALEYYLKAVTIIESLLDKRDHMYGGYGNRYSRLHDPYFEETVTLRHDLCEIFHNIACVYERSTKYKQDKTATEAEEYRLKTLEMQPRGTDSAFYHQQYANYLTKYKRKYSDAIDSYGNVEELVDSREGTDWMGRTVIVSYGDWFDCLLRLERYTEAEAMCLRWIQRAQYSNKDDYHLKHAYGVIIRLYKDYLKQPEAANLYSSMRSKLCNDIQQ
eukprot:902788_1